MVMATKERELRRRLDAMIESFSDGRLRWLVGKGRALVEKGEVKQEEYDALMGEVLRTEMERKMIIGELRSGPLTAIEVSKRLPLTPKEALEHLIALRQLNVVAVGEREGELEFRLL